MGLLPKKTIRWDCIENDNYREKALKKGNFAQKYLTLKSRLQHLQTHFKFMVVRNPLEGLVLGYRNKIEPPLNPEGTSSLFRFLKNWTMVAVEHVISIDSKFYGLGSVPRGQRQQ